MLLGAVMAGSCAPPAKNEYAAPREQNSEPSMTMSLLEPVSNMKIADYDPGRVIEAVNALQPLGKTRALEEIESYLAGPGKGKESYGLFWVLRVLFDVPAETGFPPVRIGQPSVAPPARSGALPRFPIVMVRDTPLLAVRSYMLGGLPEPVASHVAYFRAHGTIRATPLSPSASTADLEAEFEKQWSEAYGSAPAEDVRTWIRAQLTR
jgi:hypothetical protein